ncbi:MAG: DUF2007 domain-containing protein [Acidobacteria bacterium]|nr:DUF2007 domain-containing protein [Acidobacteriota bacterium]
MSEISFVAVRTFSDRIEAELAQSALQAAGIESMLRADDAGTLEPPLAMSNGITVMVRIEDAVAAGEVLALPPRRARRTSG